jgi:regulator of nucleoside diphosphate kinase
MRRVLRKRAGLPIDVKEYDMNHDRTAEIRPPIAIDATHFARLSALSSVTGGSMTEVCDYLREELDRAHVLPAERLRPDIVSLGSKVEFRDEQTGKIQEVVLVYPFDADIARRRVSVLTPVGAALLGLSVNQTISFRNRTGERRELTVLKVGRAEVADTGEAG